MISEDYGQEKVKSQKKVAINQCSHSYVLSILTAITSGFHRKEEFSWGALGHRN